MYHNLFSLYIPEYNNILMKIGYHTYEKVLIKSKFDNLLKDLTPEVFRTTVGSELKLIGKAKLCTIAACF